MKKLSVLFVAFLALTAASVHALEVYPDSNWTPPIETKIENFKPAAYFMFGLDYRTDDHTRLYVSPGVIADFMLQFNPAIGIKAGIGYNADTQYSGVEAIRTYSTDLALHLELPSGNIRPFLESGLRYMYYEESHGSYINHESQTGIFGGFGLSLMLKNENRFDIGLNTLWNRFDNYYITDELPYDPNIDYSKRPIDGNGDYKFARRLYNPVTLEIEMRLKL
jgi:hypothetical protein